MSEEKRNPFTAQRIMATILMFLGCLWIEGSPGMPIDLSVRLGLFVAWVVFEYKVLRLFD